MKFPETSIEANKLIMGMNNAGVDFNAFLVSFVLKRIETEEDRHRHNFVVDLIEGRIGDEKGNLAITVADNIEQYSLRNMEHEKGQTKKG